MFRPKYELLDYPEVFLSIVENFSLLRTFYWLSKWKWIIVIGWSLIASPGRDFLVLGMYTLLTGWWARISFSFLICVEFIVPVFTFQSLNNLSKTYCQ